MTFVVNLCLRCLSQIPFRKTQNRSFMEGGNANESEDKRKNAHPKQKANILSKMFFCWTLPTFIKGAKRELDENDLCGTLRQQESTKLGDKLENVWIALEQLGKPSLFKTIIKVYKYDLILIAIALSFLEFCLKLSQPILLGKLMLYYEPEPKINRTEAIVYASGIVLVQLINVICSHNYMLFVQTTGMKMRISCCSLVYRKALRLSKVALAETTIGQMVNLLSNDVNRFDYCLIHMNHIWLAPLETILCLYFLYSNLGVHAVSGILMLFCFIPLQLYMGKKTSVYRLRTALKTDERVRLMNEIISGIQVIKMYTWEKPFAKLVELARKFEIDQIKATSYLRAVTLSFSMFINRTAIYLSIMVYVVTGHSPHASYVYVVITYYNILRQAMTMSFPQGITSFAEVNVSIKRIEKFLNFDEIANNYKAIRAKSKKLKSKMSNSSSLQRINSTTMGVTIINGTAKWISSQENTLTSVNFSVTRGQLVAIVGPVGSGKTSLLHAILRELPLIKGEVEVGGIISYASQEPWLFAGTIRQNILFGEPFEIKKYEQVIKVCALKRDLKLLAFGDKTIVGERGVTLSGGQKARINLARAIYKEADIYLLDDPLSAVDTHVGKQLFEECITHYLHSKCVVLVTHQLQYLRNVHKIYLLEDGKVAAQGTYQGLKNSGIEYAKQFGDEPEHIEDEVELEKRRSRGSIHVLQEFSQTEIKEHRNTGTISKYVYKNYVRSGGSYCAVIWVLSLFILAQSTAAFCDYFISYWVNLEQLKSETKPLSTATNSTLSDTKNKTHENSTNVHYENSFLTTNICLYIYTATISLTIFLSLYRSIYFFKFCMKASINLHNNMFNKIVYAPMLFFNTNASGRILNRFSKDIGSIDEILPTVVNDTFQIGLGVLTISILVAVVNVYVLIPTFLILCIFYSLRVYYLKTSRSIKRMEGTTRSPVFSHMNASLQGLTTIRAFGAQDILQTEFDHHQDLHTSTFFMFLACTRAFGMWLDLICVFYIAFVTLGLLFISNETLGGNVGLSITQALSLTGMFQWGMRQWSELENQMTCVERVNEYTELIPEKDTHTKKPPRFWPAEGEIEFKSVSLKYSETEPYVLKKLSFLINPKEKVGIVGRTGAGKSSLISALFRLSDLEGEILIDKVNTKDLTFNQVRSKISIIPQEPVLFSGSLRYNLDPFEEFDDNSLWDALEQVELKEVINDAPGGLDSSVSEGGSNFSVGQRQLICLARAIIRNNKILVLDEATANVDPRTDNLIQATIRKTFNDCTVLTIAHRLHTVMDSDKVLVMDAGKAVEFDHPFVLLQNKDSIFYSLAKQSGTSVIEGLIKIAEQNFTSQEQ